MVHCYLRSNEWLVDVNAKSVSVACCLIDTNYDSYIVYRIHSMMMNRIFSFTSSLPQTSFASNFCVLF